MSESEPRAAFPFAESAVLQETAVSFGAAVNLDFIVNDHIQGREARALLARLARRGFDLGQFPFHDFFYEEPEGWGQWTAIGLVLTGLVLMASGTLGRALLGLAAALLAGLIWVRSERARRRIAKLRASVRVQPLSARALALWLGRNGQGPDGHRWH